MDNITHQNPWALLEHVAEDIGEEQLESSTLKAASTASSQPQALPRQPPTGSEHATMHIDLDLSRQTSNNLPEQEQPAWHRALQAVYRATATVSTTQKMQK